MTLNIIIVDDSVVFRSQIKKAIESIDNTFTTKAVSNGKIALEFIDQNHFDVMILNMETPTLDGLGTLEGLKSRKSTIKTIVFASNSQRGSDNVIKALGLGAFEILEKPASIGLSPDDAYLDLQRELAPVLSAINFSNRTEHIASVSAAIEASTSREIRMDIDLIRPAVILIGSSTGGPAALEEVLGEINGQLNKPILIVQHMPPVFTKSLANRLAQVTGVEVIEASANMRLEYKIYVAPGNYHMRLRRDREEIYIALDQAPLINSVRPAVDPLFESAAEIFGQKCLGIILTGMGADGAKGCQIIRSHKGAVIIQDEDSCAVYGMPRSVAELNSYDLIANPKQIAHIIKQKVTL